MRKIIPPVCAFVQGNGAPSFVTCEFDPVPQNKNPNLQKIPYHLVIPKVQILNAAGKKIFISHGHLQSVDYGDEVFINEANTEGCSIILHGHTHISRHKTENGIHIINPGSISLPRGGTPASFAILTIHGQYIDATFKKISKNSFESFHPLW